MNFACPSCGFRVFNRRYSKCERCGKDLPQEMLLSPYQIDRLNAEAEASRRIQQIRAAQDQYPHGLVPAIPVPVSVLAAEVAIDIAQDIAGDIVQGLSNDAC